MKSTVPATIFTTSSTDEIKSTMTNKTEVFCEKIFTDISTHPAFIFSYSLVFLVSLVLNCITMRVYFCNKQPVKSSITVYMKNLAAADFFLCLCLPLRIANNAHHSITIRNIYCSFGATAFYLNMYASILFMDFIAANRSTKCDTRALWSELTHVKQSVKAKRTWLGTWMILTIIHVFWFNARYLKIVRPLETHTLQKVRTARHISAATWLFLIITTSIYLILFLQTSWNYDQQKISCESLHSWQTSLAYKIIHCVSIAVFMFVQISLVILYWKTLQKIRQSESSTQTVSSSRTFDKSKRNMLILVVVFIVCFVPYHLVRLPYVFSSDCTIAQALNILKELTILLSVLNVCLDPLIYFIYCKAFRAQLRKKKALERSSNKQT